MIDFLGKGIGENKKLLVDDVIVFCFILGYIMRILEIGLGNGNCVLKFWDIILKEVIDC